MLDNRTWEANKDMKNYDLSKDYFQNLTNDRRPFFAGNCGDLTIAGCTFFDLQSWQYEANSGGGALLVEQDCIVMIHECFFNLCRSNMHGGTRHRGAQFDIQCDNEVTSSNINTTGGKSKYCSGIEYRHSQIGHFKFQTVTEMRGKFVTSFASLTTEVDIFM